MTSPLPNYDIDLKLAELNFSNHQLATLYRRCAIERCLPFWFKHGVDHQLGGFFSDVLDDGSLACDAKGGWHQGFGIWLFAHFHNHWRNSEKYLDAALRAWRFMRDHGRDHKGQWVMCLSRLGEVREGASSVFTDIYLAHGLVELYRADPNDSYLETARTTVRQVRERIQHSDFSQSAPAYTEPHSLNSVWGCLLGAVTDLLQVLPGDAGLAEMADLCVQTMLEKHLDEATNLFVEAVAPDGTAYRGRQCNLVKPGAAAEACTALMLEARRRGDRDLQTRATEVLQKHFAAGWDRDFGGIYYEITVDGCRPVEDRKDAWVQAEFMRSLMTAGEVEAEEWIAAAYHRVHEWAFGMYADEPDDLWRLSATRDGAPVWGRRRRSDPSFEDAVVKPSDSRAACCETHNNIILNQWACGLPASG